MASKAAIKSAFLSQPRFAVVGASTDESKWGTKVLKWYKERDLTVTPVHPRESKLQGITAVKKLADLPEPDSTAFIKTQITMTLLPAMLANPAIPYIWLQPGTYDDTVTSFIADNGLEDRVVHGDHACVLVEGDAIRARL